MLSEKNTGRRKESIFFSAVLKRGRKRGNSLRWKPAHESASGHEFPCSSDDAIAAALNHQRSQGLHQSASRRATLLSARRHESRVKHSACRPPFLFLKCCRKSGPGCLAWCVARRSVLPYAFRALLPCTLVPLQRGRSNTFPLSCLLCCRRAAATLLIVSASCVRLPASDCGLLAKTMALFFPPWKDTSII